jgi:membrane fusion protein (multidrug efflux system)
MFRIMPRVYEAELQAAKAETEFAQIEYDNTRALQENNVVSPNELKLAKAKLDKAAAEQQLAQVHVSLTEVRAPFDGIMNRLEVRKGSLLEEGELLSTLSDNHEMWVYFNVTEAEYLDYKQRLSEDDEPATVQLMMANHQLFPYEGKVSTIEADFNNETGNIAFRATFPNPDGLLRHGETGKVLMSTPIDNALLVPQKATFEILDKRYVFVVDEEGVVHQRRIEVLEELPHVFVVGDGVEADDHILIDGLRKVQDGEEVSIQLEAPEEAFAHLDVHAE